MSDYEHVIRGADAHSPEASEPPESQFLRSSGEMDSYQGDGDEYMTTRFQSFQDPLQQYQHPDSASQPQANHPYRITDGSDERQMRRPPGPPRTCSALNPPSWWRGRLGAEPRSPGFCAASLELSGVDSNLPADHPADAGSRSAARRHVGEGSAHDPENLRCPTIDTVSHVH